MNSEQLLDDQYSGKNLGIPDYKFLGKLAGKKVKYDQSINYLEQTQKLIYAMGFMIFFPVILASLFGNIPDIDVFIERIIVVAIFIACGLFYKKYRLAMIIISLLLFSLFVFFTGWSYIRLALIGLNTIGLYFHFKENKQRKELMNFVAENHPDIRTRT